MPNYQRDPKVGLTYLELDALNSADTLCSLSELQTRMLKTRSDLPSEDYLRVKLHGLVNGGYLRLTERSNPNGGKPKYFYIRTKKGKATLSASKRYQGIALRATRSR